MSLKYNQKVTDNTYRYKTALSRSKSDPTDNNFVGKTMLLMMKITTTIII